MLLPFQNKFEVVENWLSQIRFDVLMVDGNEMLDVLDGVI